MFVINTGLNNLPRGAKRRELEDFLTNYFSKMIDRDFIEFLVRDLQAKCDELNEKFPGKQEYKVRFTMPENIKVSPFIFIRLVNSNHHYLSIQLQEIKGWYQP